MPCQDPLTATAKHRRIDRLRRTRARLSPAGEQVLLLDQDRSRWDWLLVGRGLAALERAAAEFERAARLTGNTRQRAVLLERAAAAIRPRRKA